MNSLPAPDLINTACPLCGSTNSKRMLTAKDNLCGVPGLYHVDRCQDCRHLFMNPRPTAETLARCYPEHYGPHQAIPPANPLGQNPPGQNPPTNQSTQNLLAQNQSTQGSLDAEAARKRDRPWYLKLIPLRYVPGLKSLFVWWMEDRGQPLPEEPIAAEGDKTALELGCSTGAYLGRLRQVGWEVVGIEPSESASEKARRAGFTVHTGTLEEAEIIDQSFDSIAAWMVLEHTIDPVATLNRFSSLLPTGGQLLFSVPNAGCWERFLFGSSWYVWELPRHLHHFTPGQLRRLLTDAGFDQIRIIHQRNVLNLIGSVAIFLRRWSFTRKVAERMLRYPDQPRLLVQLALSPVAHLLALIGQGGRLTVTARKAPGKPLVDQPVIAPGKVPVDQPDTIPAGLSP